MNKFIFVLLVAIVICQRQLGSSSNCLNPSWWNGNRCQCPRNMVNVNGRCTCDYGYLLKDNRCIQCFLADNSCKVESKDCFPGTIFNQSYCVHDWNVSYCNKGFYWNGIFCTKYVMPLVCQPGYRWNGQACVLSLVSKCPKGYFWNGNYCQTLLLPIYCSSGFRWDALAECCVAQDIRKCQDGNVWNGAVCVSKDGFKCQAGTYFNGQLCVAIGNNMVAGCAAGYYWNGRGCSSILPRTCFERFLYDELSSTCLMFLCPKDNVFDPLNYACVAKIQTTSKPMPVQTQSTQGQSTISQSAQPIQTQVLQTQPRSDVRQGGVAIASPGFVSVARAGELAIDNSRIRQGKEQTKQEPTRMASILPSNELARPIQQTQQPIQQPIQPVRVLEVPRSQAMNRQSSQNSQHVYQLSNEPTQLTLQPETSSNPQGIAIGGSSFSIGNARSQGGDGVVISGNSARYSAGSISDSRSPSIALDGNFPSSEVENLLSMASQARALNNQQVVVQRY